MRRVCLVMVLLVSGCNGTPANFWRGLTRGLCKYNRDCGLKYTNNSVGACADGMYEDSIEPGEFADLCEDYDGASGRDCLEYLRELRDSCVEIDTEPAACAGVCGSGTQLGFTRERSADSTVVAPLLLVDEE